MAGPRRSRRGPVARALARGGGDGERLRALQRAAARVLAHSVGARAGRSLAESARDNRRAWHAAQRGAGLGGGVLGVRAVAVRRTARRGCASLQPGAWAR